MRRVLSSIGIGSATVDTILPRTELHPGDTVEIPGSFTLAPEESRTARTDVTLPPWTPITRGDQAVWLRTVLDIEWAVDPSDEDAIDVVPGPTTTSTARKSPLPSRRTTLR